MSDSGLTRLIISISRTLAESFERAAREGYKRATDGSEGKITETVQRVMDADARGPGRFNLPIVGTRNPVDPGGAGMLDMAPGAAVAGKPITDGTREFLKIFPELRGINPGFSTGEWGFRHNCASCAVAVDRRLAGKYVTAIKRPKSAEDDWRWPDDLLKAVGTRNRFQPVAGFAEIEKTMLSAGPEARGIIYGIRRDVDGKLVATHTFNVINRKRRVFYVDGQHGGWANIDGYAELRLLRTN
ncbi:toxin glutamine deamidase domain-containing protein [Nocardia sp. NPDC004168]|uniref:toxin glutamine deamidase domain-containing protein n=1 Tax=Nocardia sp. NPDC004168 TaxID=3154452 RepID=UPI0033B88B10